MLLYKTQLGPSAELGKRRRGQQKQLKSAQKLSNNPDKTDVMVGCSELQSSSFISKAGPAKITKCKDPCRITKYEKKYGNDFTILSVPLPLNNHSRLQKNDAAICRHQGSQFAPTPISIQVICLHTVNCTCALTHFALTLGWVEGMSYNIFYQPNVSKSSSG